HHVRADVGPGRDQERDVTEPRELGVERGEVDGDAHPASTGGTPKRARTSSSGTSTSARWSIAVKSPVHCAPRHIACARNSAAPGRASVAVLPVTDSLL